MTLGINHRQHAMRVVAFAVILISVVIASGCAKKKKVAAAIPPPTPSVSAAARDSSAHAFGVAAARGSASRCDGNRYRELVRVSLSRAASGERRDLRHGEAHRRASHLAV